MYNKIIKFILFTIGLCNLYKYEDDAKDKRSQCFFFFFSVFSNSSLALRPLKIGLGFPHDKFPFCSVPSSCSSTFFAHFPLNSNSTSSIELNLHLLLSPLLPGLPSTNFCTVLSPPILTRPSHSDLRTSITFTVAEDLNFICFLVCSDSSVGIATGHGLDRPGIVSRCARIFLIRLDRPWGPPILLNNGYRVSFTGVNRPGRGVDHPHL